MAECFFFVFKDVAWILVSVSLFFVYTSKYCLVLKRNYGYHDNVPTLTTFADKYILPPLPPPPGPDISQHAVLLLPWQLIKLLEEHESGQPEHLNMKDNVRN